MDAFSVFGGPICLALGIWITIKQIRKFKAGKQDKLGFDIKLLGGGILFIMGGIALIASQL